MTPLPTLAQMAFGTEGEDVVTTASLGMFVQRKQGHLGRRKQIIDLYDSLRPSLFAYLSCLGLRADVAEDVIQESFLRLVVHLSEGGKEENLRGWVFRVAHNLSIDVHRADSSSFESRREVHHANPTSTREASHDPDEAAGSDEAFDPADKSLNPEEVVLRNEQLRLLEGAIGQLTPQQRHCVLLRAEGLRYREIANVLGISIKRVSELVQRSLVRLLEGR